MRHPNDYYPTHAAATHLLLAHVPIDGQVLEPCAAEGGMATVLAGGQHVTILNTNDIDPQFNTTWHSDARCRESAVWQAGQPDWVVTNPPFSAAFPILQIAMEQARVGVAFLLRLSFLEPTQERGAWLADHADILKHIIILGQPRPSFTPDGKTDSVTAAWLVWDKRWSWKGQGVVCPFLFSFGWKQYADELFNEKRELWQKLANV